MFCSQAIIWFQLGMLWDAKITQQVTADVASNFFERSGLGNEAPQKPRPIDQLYRLRMPGLSADILPS
jgi:hypothetical protein